MSARSCYLSDGGYLLVTTSKEIMRRFIETGLKDGDGRGLSATAGRQCP